MGTLAPSDKEAKGTGPKEEVSMRMLATSMAGYLGMLRLLDARPEWERSSEAIQLDSDAV